MPDIRPYAKAVAAFLIPGLTILVSAITSGSDGGSGITATEWASAAIASLLAAATVYAVPNRQPAPAPTGPEPPSEPLL